MSYPEFSSSVRRSQQSTYSGSNSSGVWPEFAMNDGQFGPHSEFEQQQQHPYKRAKHSEDGQLNVVHCTPMNSRMPLNLPVNKGTTNIFFKTRMCAKFRQGACRNGEGCNFAHGLEDLRQPPHNWQELAGGRDVHDEERSSGNWDDDQKIIHRMKLCKKFYNGEECPYGDRCNFLHEDPSKFKDDMGRFRESLAISIGTTGPTAGLLTVSDQSEFNRPLNSAASDVSRVNVKPGFWKTKLCTKFETTGHCPFGEKCHFAHGQAELQGFGGRGGGGGDGDFGNAGFGLTRNGSSVTEIHDLPANDVTANDPSENEEAQTKKCLFKWKGPRKINTIYGDWLNDLPLAQTLPSQVES